MITWKEGEMRDMVNHSTRIAIFQEHNLRVWGQQVKEDTRVRLYRVAPQCERGGVFFPRAYRTNSPLYGRACQVARQPILAGPWPWNDIAEPQNTDQLVHFPPLGYKT